MRDATLIFLVKREKDTISDICLAVKKRGFGKDRFNGFGGKVEVGESIEDAVRRETEEECGVILTNLEKHGEIEFTFPHNLDFNQRVHIYLSSEWNGDPVETEEMSPSWMNVLDIPYHKMWADDIFWLPHVLDGKKVRGKFTFAEGDIVKEQEVIIIK